jgi:hypothetical protein
MIDEADVSQQRVGRRRRSLAPWWRRYAALNEAGLRRALRTGDADAVDDAIAMWLAYG